MITGLNAAADQLDQMRRDYIVIDHDGGMNDDYAHLVTMDAKVAEK